MSHDTANNSGGGGAAIASDNSVNLVTMIKGLKNSTDGTRQDSRHG